MYSLWNLGIMEKFGYIQYLKETFLLIILSFIVQIITYKVLIERFSMENYKNVHAIGYSCVVFGWMTISSMKFKIPFMGIPFYLTPWISLMITQFIVPNASFVGHFSGIIGGYMIYFQLFSWFSNFLFYCCLIWIILLILYSLRNYFSFSHSSFNDEIQV